MTNVSRNLNHHGTQNKLLIRKAKREASRIKNFIAIFLLLLFSCSSNSALLKRVEVLEAEVKSMQEQQIVITDDGNEGWTILPFQYFPEWLEEESTKFCQECLEQGLKSSVSVGITMTTAMSISEYYDEDGDYHYNDPNFSTTNYSCSQGHSWSE